jgi:tetratricopeptide (TPR) repeat protein
MDDFKGFIDLAAECINNHQYTEAEQYIKSAMILDMTAPQPHNLFGILLEYKGDRLRAVKHYRAATDLDPTYMPAKNNLYRIGRAFPDLNDRIDFGGANGDATEYGVQKQKFNKYL